MLLSRRRVLVTLAGAIFTVALLRHCVEDLCTSGHHGSPNLDLAVVEAVVDPTSSFTHGTTAGSGPSNECEDSVCSRYLTAQERTDFASCSNRAAKQLNTTLETSTCRFMNGSGRKPVALASFPGSGNTWVRGLLQLATGMCTGSLYCDKSLRRGGFPGEGVRSGSVLVVKTHKWKPRNRRLKSNLTEHFSAAIFIVRNPFHALVSERHRMASLHHTDLIGSEHFGEI